MPTLNQYIKTLNNIADAHRQIASFGSGKIDTAATSGTVLYPAMWVETSDFNIESEDLGASKVVTNLTVYLIDRLKKGEDNLNEVHSDTQQIALDVIAQLFAPTGYDFVIGRDYSAESLWIQFQDDEVAGWKLNLQFIDQFTRDRCQIPFTSAPTQGGVEFGVVLILDQNGNVIATPTGTYSVTVLTGIQDTIDSNSASIIIDNLT